MKAKGTEPIAAVVAATRRQKTLTAILKRSRSEKSQARHRNRRSLRRKNQKSPENHPNQPAIVEPKSWMMRNWPVVCRKRKAGARHERPKNRWYAKFFFWGEKFQKDQIPSQGQTYQIPSKTQKTRFQVDFLRSNEK